jgi:predicted DNA-binding transcriptional regulator AlpA
MRTHALTEGVPHLHDEDSYNRFIDRHELHTLVPLHPSQLARLEAIGEFPLRIRLGRARIAWSLREVVEWMEARKAERDGGVV